MQRVCILIKRPHKEAENVRASSTSERINVGRRSLVNNI